MGELRRGLLKEQRQREATPGRTSASRARRLDPYHDCASRRASLNVNGISVSPPSPRHQRPNVKPGCQRHPSYADSPVGVATGVALSLLAIVLSAPSWIVTRLTARVAPCACFEVATYGAIGPQRNCRANATHAAIARHQGFPRRGTVFATRRYGVCGRVGAASAVQAIRATCGLPCTTPPCGPPDWPLSRGTATRP